jgi:hypothetical protein
MAELSNFTSDTEPLSDLLRADDFHAFFETRQESLLHRIESAMGKPIARDSVLPAEDVIDNTDEQPEE